MDSRAILLVEDNPDDELLTLRALRKSHVGNPVRVARNGQEALDVLVDPAVRVPAIVLLDLNLPKVTGLDVLLHIRTHERTKLLPVIILTSSMDEADLLSAYGRGCNSYICKPVAFDRFLTVVGQLGQYWLTHNEVPPYAPSQPVGSGDGPAPSARD